MLPVDETNDAARPAGSHFRHRSGLNCFGGCRCADPASGWLASWVTEDSEPSADPLAVEPQSGLRG